MIHNSNKRKTKKSQRGATLAIGLILLLIMTLIGVTALKTTALQEKMAGGLHNKVLAEAGVESALREAEDYLWNYYQNSNGVPLIANLTASVGVHSWNAPDAIAFRTSKDWVNTGTEYGNNNSHKLTGIHVSANLKKEPRYIIEEIVNSGSGGSETTIAEFGETEISSGYGESSGLLRSFRITARSVSGDGKITSMAQSVFTTRTD